MSSGKLSKTFTHIEINKIIWSFPLKIHLKQINLMHLNNKITGLTAQHKQNYKLVTG